MTADMENVHCIICDGKVDETKKNGIHIFKNDALTSSGKPLLGLISTILETSIKVENEHSSLICIKCFDNLNQVDELECKLLKLKTDIINSYKTVNTKVAEENNSEDFNDHDYLENLESLDSENEISSLIKINKNKSNKEKEQSEEGPLKNSEFEKQEESIPQSINENESFIEEVILGSGNVKKEKQELEKVVSKDGENYTCLLCTENVEAVDAKSIIAHVKEKHDVRLYICDYCGDDFRKRNELSAHVDEHVAKEQGDFQCEVCNRIFNNLRLFRIHKRIHLPQAKSWTCELCGKGYSSKNLLDEHKNTHTGNRPYMCDVCGKNFASKYTYKAHVRTHEVRPRPFECTDCNKGFLTQQNLNQHLKTHVGVKEHVCDTCGKAFGSAHNLEVHNIVHTGYKPFICNECGKAFARKAEIRDHERTHTGEKPFQCEFCGATFSQRSNLQSHKRATHFNDKRYKCDECGKGFKRRRLLDYHIKAAHTGERPFKCDTCGATFVYPEHFKKHTRIHTGEKPYLCEVCGKAFNSRDNRNAHRFIHSDKKPYECLVCGMGFMRKPLLYAHMQTQGHLNDTIVVNQPRLTTEDDPTTIQLLMETDTENMDEESRVIVTEIKHPIVIESNTQKIYKSEEVMGSIEEEEEEEEDEDNDEEINHVAKKKESKIRKTHIIECKEEELDDESFNYQENTNTIILPAGTDYKELIKNSKNGVKLVQIHVPQTENGETKSWFEFVQET